MSAEWGLLVKIFSSIAKWSKRTKVVLKLCLYCLNVRKLKHEMNESLMNYDLHYILNQCTCKHFYLHMHFVGLKGHFCPFENACCLTLNTISKTQTKISINKTKRNCFLFDWKINWNLFSKFNYFYRGKRTDNDCFINLQKTR